MRSTFLVSLLALLPAVVVRASPLPANAATKGPAQPYFDLEGHRGGRGEDSEETLYAYATGVLAGARSLEFDIGITSDGHPVAWHDESIAKEKCKDTKPVTPNDPLFPYVGKYIKELSLKQIKSLDCGSQRLAAFPLQVTHPGAKIQTLEQVLDFGLCADGPERTLDFNIESKLTPTTPNTTVGPEQFVKTLLSTYRRYGIVDRVTFQSFDWRTIILAKAQEPKIRTVALISYDTLYGSGTLVDDGTPSPWLGGISVSNQKGPSVSEKIAQAAKEAKASVLSPDHSTYGGEVGDAKFIPFVNATMANEAHRLGLTLVPYTVNSLNSADKLLADKVDGLITDYPTTLYKWAKGKRLRLPAPGKASRVAKCLKQALAKDGQ